MKSDTKIGIFVVLALVAVVVVLLGREIMNRKKAAPEPTTLAERPPEGTDEPLASLPPAPGPESVNAPIDAMKTEVGTGAPPAPPELAFDPSKPPATGTGLDPLPGTPPVDGGVKVAEVPPLPAGPQEYEVKSGDHLEGIAKQFLGKRSLWPEIVKANPGVNPNRLKIGMKLNIPAAPAVAEHAAPSADPMPPASGRTYTVKSGDRLESISKQVYGKRSLWTEIAKANPGVNPSRLKIGTVLQLPEVTASAPVAGSDPAPKVERPVDPWRVRGATRLVTR